MSARVEIDWNVLDALCQFKVTLAHVCDYMNVSRDAVIRRIREKHDMTFVEYRDLKQQRTATKLQQKAVEMALGGNTTMMIFALKNLAKWSDKIDETTTSKIEVHIREKDTKL